MKCCQSISFINFSSKGFYLPSLSREGIKGWVRGARRAFLFTTAPPPAPPLKGRGVEPRGFFNPVFLRKQEPRGSVGATGPRFRRGTIKMGPHSSAAVRHTNFPPEKP